MIRLAGPAYRIETPRLCLRCFQPSDLERFSEAVDASLAHLRPWMSWAAHEPLAPAQRLELLRTRRGHFDLGGDLSYGLFDKASTRMLGAAGLVLRGEVDEREVGYWIRSDSLRQGLATEAVAALVRVGFEVEQLASLELRLQPDNLASLGVAKKLGFLGPTLDPLSEPQADGEKRDMHVYTLPRVVYASLPAQRWLGSELAAFDVLERRLL